MVTLVRLAHPLNNAEPMTDTPSGISMALRLLQPEKSVSALIPSGNVILASLVQSAYLQPIITQYFIDNKSEIWLLFLIAHSKR